MGFSQKAAILTVSTLRPYYSYSRSLNFRSMGENKTTDCLLSFERKFGGTIVNPKLFEPLLEQFISKLKNYKRINLKEQILCVEIPFAVAEDEEFFIDNIYRTGQQKLFNRLSDKATKAIERLSEENILICTSNIAEYVVLYK